MNKVNRRVVIEEVDKSIMALSTSDKWIELYQDSFSLVREKIINTMFNSVNKIAVEYSKDRRVIYIPNLGTFKVKLARLVAVTKKKELLQEYGFDTLTQAPDNIQELINKEVGETVRKHINSVKCKNRVKYDITIKNK